MFPGERSKSENVRMKWKRQDEEETLTSDALCGRLHRRGGWDSGRLLSAGRRWSPSPAMICQDHLTSWMIWLHRVLVKYSFQAKWNKPRIFCSAGWETLFAQLYGRTSDLNCFDVCPPPYPQETSGRSLSFVIVLVVNRPDLALSLLAGPCSSSLCWSVPCPRATAR